MSRFIEIRFGDIKREIENFLKAEYNKAGILFTTASPYGQILGVLENLHQLSFLYLKNAMTGLDISTPNNLNERIIKNAAIFAGHIPGRAISASGTLKFSLKTNIELEKDIPGGKITFFNKLNVKNKTNSLDYSFNIGTERVTHRITPNYQFFVPIIQGKWNTKTFTGFGEPLQSFSANETGQKDVENFNVEVTVNGDLWSIKKHIYEMIPDEQAVVVRTGFNGGVDIIFGNGGFGAIPPLGAPIQVSYLTTEGSLGNIFRRTKNDWTFVGSVLDGNGQTLDMDKVFNIDIYNDITFGADGETLEFTRTVLPIASNNFVLALPQQYAYEIKKLGVFSHVNAYEKSGTIFIAVVPNINLFKNQNSDYFTIDRSAFTLDTYEKSKVDNYLRTSGVIQLTRKYKIVNPKLSYYVMNVFVIPYADASDDSVNAQILEKVSNYFLALSRIDRIPKLDIIRELSTITDIHSVDIQFVSKKNEDYHKEMQLEMQNQLNKSADTGVARQLPNYDPTVTLGLDSLLGDILFEPEEMPIIRGGWVNRDNVYYSGDIETNGLKSVNIIKKGTVDTKNRPIK
jgi:hypothetical protein